MKRHLIPIKFATILASLSLAQADDKATVRFDQPNVHRFYAPEPVAPATSNPSGDGQSWDNFQFAQGEKIVEFQWEGGFLDIPNLSDPQVPPADDIGQWEISIWSDNNGLPGSVLYSETRPSSEVPRIELPSQQFSIVGGGNGFNRFRFFFSLSDHFEAQPDQTYWISPVFHANFDWPEFGLHGAASSGSPIPQDSTAAVRGPVDGHVTRFPSGTIEKRTDSNLTIGLRTLPVNDADQDGMDDDWERQHGLEFDLDESAADPDEDLSSNLQEFARGTDPNIPDTDGDGLLDGYETGTGIYVDETDTGTSPLLADSDRDGLSDQIEDPRQVFVDAGQPGTDPNNYDTDGDEYGDLLEIEQGLDPLDDNSFPALNILAGLIGGDLTDPEDDGIFNGPSASEITFDFQEADNATSSGNHQDLYDNQTTGLGSDWATEVPIGFSGKLFLWSEVAFERPIVLDTFTFTSSRSNPQDDPVAWEIQGSYDGIHFETIFHRNDPDAPVWSARSQTVRFDAGVHYRHPAAYKIFRFSAHNHRDTQLTEKFQLGEIELFGTDATLIVTNTDNEGPGSLRQAIADCPKNGIINFAPELDGETILFAHEEQLEVTRSLTIDASPLPNGITLSAIDVSPCIEQCEGNLYILSIAKNATAFFDSLTFANTQGGGISNRGSLTIRRCTITGNVRVTFRFLSGAGGGIYNGGTLNIERSTVSGNIAARGAAIVSNHSLSINNSTISGNTGGLGGVIVAGNDSQLVSIRNSTIVNNIPSGLSVRGGELEISDSIIAGNSSHDQPELSSDVPISLTGRNLIYDLNGSGLTEGPNIIVADPRLAPLGDYGGPTPTMIPMPGSPAIDAATSTSPTDQRGFPIVNLPDIGATEYQGDPDFARVLHVDNDGDGTPFGIEQALGTDPYTADPQNPRNLTFPSFTPGGHAVLSFGINPDAHPGTIWILERSTDLRTFSEVLRHDGSITTHAENISSLLDGSSLTVTDENPPPNNAYYRFRAMLNPTN